MIMYLSLAVALAGLFIYLLSAATSKAEEIGRILLWTGLLAFLIKFGGGPVSALH